MTRAQAALATLALALVASLAVAHLVALATPEQPAQLVRIPIIPFDQPPPSASSQSTPEDHDR
jgi:hypothetical protein